MDGTTDVCSVPPPESTLSEPPPTLLEFFAVHHLLGAWFGLCVFGWIRVSCLVTSPLDLGFRAWADLQKSGRRRKLEKVQRQKHFVDTSWQSSLMWSKLMDRSLKNISHLYNGRRLHLFATSIDLSSSVVFIRFRQHSLAEAFCSLLSQLLSKQKHRKGEWSYVTVVDIIWIIRIWPAELHLNPFKYIFPQTQTKQFFAVLRVTN